MGVIDLGTLGGESEALDVNCDGQVVGRFVRPEGGNGTFLWTMKGGMRDITPRRLTLGARPVGIDSEGRIAVHDDQGDVGTTRSVVLVPWRP